MLSSLDVSQNGGWITLTHITKTEGYRGTKHSKHLEEITDITPRKLSVYVFLRTWKQN